MAPSKAVPRLELIAATVFQQASEFGRRRHWNERLEDFMFDIQNVVDAIAALPSSLSGRNLEFLSDVLVYFRNRVEYLILLLAQEEDDERTRLRLPVVDRSLHDIRQICANEDHAEAHQAPADAEEEEVAP